jgi:hypothetical protein
MANKWIFLTDMNLGRSHYIDNLVNEKFFNIAFLGSIDSKSKIILACIRDTNNYFFWHMANDIPYPLSSDPATYPIYGDPDGPDPLTSEDYKYNRVQYKYDDMLKIINKS